MPGQICWLQPEITVFARMGNHAKRVNVRCALWMMRAVFTCSNLGPKTSVCEKNVMVVSAATGCDVTYCATTLQGFNKQFSISRTLRADLLFTKIQSMIRFEIAPEFSHFFPAGFAHERTAIKQQSISFAACSRCISLSITATGDSCRSWCSCIL